ncbi:MAG: calcium-binding protein [Cyanobacteria bacterium P01_F01_bin.56]
MIRAGHGTAEPRETSNSLKPTASDRCTDNRLTFTHLFWRRPRNFLLTNLVNLIIGEIFENAPGIEDLGDIIIGSTGNDQIQGGDQNDLIFAGAGNGFIVSGSGNDILVGQTGSDFALLGAGRDRFIWNNGDDSDFIKDGTGYGIGPLAN